jgi:hypothetical protein
MYQGDPRNGQVHWSASTADKTVPLNLRTKGSDYNKLAKDFGFNEKKGMTSNKPVKKWPQSRVSGGRKR